MVETAPELLVTTRSVWRACLAENHATSGSIWLVTYKKARHQQAPRQEWLFRGGGGRR